MIVVFGASGHAREIEYILRRYSDPVLKVDFFIATTDTAFTIKGIPVISEEGFLEIVTKTNEPVQAYIAIGNHNIREKIVSKFSLFSNITFPNLIHKDVKGDFGNIQMGEGNVFFPSVCLTTDITIGNHNHFNLHCSVSHDGTIGNYNTFSPGVIIAGNVSIGSHNFFGTGASVIDNVRIHYKAMIGAGAVVIRDICEEGVYVGVPAKKIE